jgi:hypothetical protein
MTDPQGGEGAGASSDAGTEDRTARNIGVGCFTAFIGMWSGGMVAVLIGRIVSGMRGAPVCEGLPLCGWERYAAAGAVIGAVTLPVLALSRLRRRDARHEHLSRG